MTTSNYFLLFCLVSTIFFSFVHLELLGYIHSIVLVSLLLVTFLAKHQENMKHLIALVSLALLLEYLTYNVAVELTEKGTPPYITNTLVIGAQLILDLIVFYILKYRVRFSLQFVKRFQPKKWQYIYTTHADILLYGVYLAFIVVDLLVLGEHLLRNMDYIFGVSEATAKPFWSWNWVYKSYPYAKSILLSCVVTILLATIFVENQRPEQEDDDEDDSDEVIHKTDQQQKP
ncbi:hypothetical protein CBQ28_21410 [Pseudoalteromonas sp. GCY]|uniref:hypothetical protein n=1 Tax=unclassified Pseudoalteromonas TaxID=194690 RepID=UPI000BFEEC31|nr:MULTISPECIES: hypothetical protein [unclassified Pseudoalteromonas]MCF7515290.1 hypothetical protein [Pseudoalteromonas sp. L7]MCF7527180.1 hypothetical protein [Pseudoalteromonas sp. L23]MCX2767037.1 hypothetical protein [Pseudoalteromonas sp. B530]PHI35119.1 hypothetical protein CBQ28_21410 [Pseudoalteromonas sp. GCY]QQQ64562.1 hypothetical protein JJQ94_02765 [Pseudoalteromonas sp. GCY]